LGGDIGYFSHFESSEADPQGQAKRSLRAIKEIFERLQTLYQKLDGLQESCRNLTKGVSQSHPDRNLPETGNADGFS
jgi:hypothetical protein